MKYHNSNLSFDFKKDGSDRVFKPILKEENVIVDMLIPNSSPFFYDKDKVPLRVDAAGHILDNDQVDTSVTISIKQQFMKLHLKQDVIIELFKILEHNIMKKDEYSKQFKTALQRKNAAVAPQQDTQEAQASARGTDQAAGQV